MRFHIYSGTNEQARTLARMMDLGRHEWTYVSSVEILRGKRNGTILLYGTWRNKPSEEIARISEMAHINLMAVLTVGDIGL